MRKIQGSYLMICLSFRLVALCCVLLSYPLHVYGDSFDKVKERKVLRHLGVPYAHFITGSGDGLDVELMQLFAAHLGVRYEYVASTWKDIFKESIPAIVDKSAKEVVSRLAWEDKGDVLANGLTILEPRKEKLLFSIPTFPSGVWLIARADSEMEPIAPSNNMDEDIQNTVRNLAGHTVLALKGGCLDPALNQIAGSGAQIKNVGPNTNLNDLVPLILRGEAESTLLDVPDALIEIQKWPGKIKIIGPLSDQQVMGVGFAKSSVRLKDEFNSFFMALVKNGVYKDLIKKYYPSILIYSPAFFAELESKAKQYRAPQESL